MKNPLKTAVESLKNPENRTVMLDEINRRILILEEKSAYQEQTIDALNDVIIDQQAQLNSLEEQLSRLRALLTTVHDRPDEGEDPPPPHY